MKRFILFVMQSSLIFIMFFCLSGCGNNSTSTGNNSGPPLTADAILTQMRQAYVNCSTYQDSGAVNETYIQNSVVSTSGDTVSFSTAFVRPNKFRFQFTLLPNTQPTDIIWSDGTEVLDWWDINPGTKAEDSLATAIARATGVSRSSAVDIPSLLMSDVGQYFALPNAQRLDDDTLNGVRCYRIKSDLDTIWIDKSTFLIQGIKSISSDSSYQRMTRYTPVANNSVADSLLAFNPPQ